MWVQEEEKGQENGRRTRFITHPKCKVRLQTFDFLLLLPVILLPLFFIC